MKFQVFSRQPTAAFSRFDDVPAKQDKTYNVSSHVLTIGGLRNALAKRSQEVREYAESYGGGAVQSSWIELDNARLNTGLLQTMVECDMKFSDVNGFYKAYMTASQIVKEVNEEMDKRYA